MSLKLLFLSTLFSSSFSLAATENLKDFKTGTDHVKSFVPEGWSPLVDYLGTPLSLLSEKGAQDQRTVIQIIPSGVKDAENKMEKIEKDPEEYYAQSEKWLEGFDGESLTYEPFKETKVDGAKVYSIGMKYKNAMGEFLDQTYYISTKAKEIYMVKAQIPLDLEEEHSPMVDQVINTLSAQN